MFFNGQNIVGEISNSLQGTFLLISSWCLHWFIEQSCVYGRNLINNGSLLQGVQKYCLFASFFLIAHLFDQDV